MYFVSFWETSPWPKWQFELPRQFMPRERGVRGLVLTGVDAVREERKARRERLEARVMYMVELVVGVLMISGWP